MLHLTAESHEAIRQHGIKSYPYEGCGLLLGHAENGINVVITVCPLPNVWPDEAEKPMRFRIAEDDWRDAEIAAMENDLDVIGVFHSHPDHDPVASARDLAWAAWPGYSYLITKIAGGAADQSRSWQLLPDRSGFVEEGIEEIF
jgi:proteasome lid subunit RPN8/RPN11